MSDKSRFRFPFLKSSPVVPLVRLEGAISATPSRFDRALNLAGVGDALDKAFTVKKAKAVALVINSPGGAPVQSNLIHRRIRELADKHDKQVLVFCEDLAASGGYWIALAGDELYADAGSIVGSIGVISASFGFTGLMEKAGVERRLYTAGKNKSMLDPFSPENPEDIKRLKTIQKGMHAQFKALVKSRREGKLTADDETLFNGDVWLGEEAAKLGLIDATGSVRAILREKFGDDVRIKPFGGPKKSLVGKLLSGGASAFAAEVEHRAAYSRFGL